MMRFAQWPFARAPLYFLCVLSSVPAAQVADAAEQRPVSVADVIEMTTADDFDGSLNGESQSPDGRLFFVILRRGNLERNTVESSLLLWEMSHDSMAPLPHELVKMSSSSNRHAIEDVSWLNNSTLTFLGENPGAHHQVYMRNLQAGSLKQITRHPTNVVSYSVAAEAGRIAFLAEKTARSLWGPKASRNALSVTTQPLVELVRGISTDDSEGNAFGPGYGLYSASLENGRVKECATIGPIQSSQGVALKLSPSGRYVVVATSATAIPRAWAEYSSPYIREWTSSETAAGQISWLKRLELVDTESGRSSVLLEAPQTFGYDVVWLPDSRSVVLSGVYLPLNDVEGAGRAGRRADDFAVEVRVPDGKISVLGPRLHLLAASSQQLIFERHDKDEPSKHGEIIVFNRQADGWVRSAKTAVIDSAIEVILKQDMNAPPVLTMMDPLTHQSTVLLDLNPEFKNLEFAKEEAVTWKRPDGRKVEGGLYYPIGYVPGRRYPLVIQTHGFRRDFFWIDGPWHTAFVAQPLAGKGIMVLQADEDYADRNTFGEIQREASTLESAVDYLSRRGLIDPDRVGLIGFSRTCLFVKYLLTHSRYHFAAASVTDGMDGGYFQYLMSGRSCPACNLTSESVYGGRPWGERQSRWTARSPGFNLDKVHTPLLITALYPLSLLGEWEWFAGLASLSKSVELIYLRDGQHELRRPADRLVSQGTNVDWFDFWLQGDEDPDPRKTVQYRRWERLCDIQVVENRNQSAFCVRSKTH